MQQMGEHDVQSGQDSTGVRLGYRAKLLDNVRGAEHECGRKQHVDWDAAIFDSGDVIESPADIENFLMCQDTPAARPSLRKTRSNSVGGRPASAGGYAHAMKLRGHKTP